MSILFAGTPKNAARTLEALLDQGVDVSLVLTRPDSKVGRKAQLTPSPVAELADSRGIQVLKVADFDSDILAVLKSRNLSFAVVVAFGVILKTEVLVALPLGWFNLHYSLLPKWRGAAPVQRSLLAGEKETGVTLFKIDAGLDTGPIVSSVSTTISPRENFGELLNRLTELGITTLLEQIPRIASGMANLHSQDTEGICFAPKISRAESKVNFLNTGESIENLVRATNPEPGAWATFKNSTLKIMDAYASASKMLEPGRISTLGGKVLVGTGDCDLVLVRVHPAGKREMLASDWYRGLGNTAPRFDLDD
jgi:methionyl-tRNA formyltransferase